MKKKKLLLLAIVVILPFQCFAFSVGIVSDVHAGKKKIRKAGSSVTYPKKAVSYFATAVRQMKSQGVDLIIALGDNIQDSSKKNYKKLKGIEKKYGIKILWVVGNHDDQKKFSILGPKTYTYDFSGTRFVALNTSLCEKSQKSRGCLHQSQIDYLNTNKTENTIVLQHIPPILENSFVWRDDFSAETGMTVWSGHWHSSFEKDTVKIFPALTEHKQLEYSVFEVADAD